MTVDDKQRLDRTLGPWLFVILRPLAQVAGKLLRRDHSGAPRGKIVFIKIMGGGSPRAIDPAAPNELRALKELVCDTGKLLP